ncbi:hydroxyquinol 1,2-dioxygenase [Paraburkholderia ginsengiterrae]|uniref:Hydroxyquinol 1,2-dioxygenase n=1 Tax=Paraburkholderia ginsengiterrae TaxID=1462993 RepID=A0A1A9MWX1_9BURK|nr:intradiol ring-cleavage dioxygenase [Paraburkholderia ginsengiterrae]OAJ52492.1 hydroxyquinol 1,2-dioxygenase [Paraburkholderia ginsengiterrae]OAJ52632.1 hydroxyquinol 1,2-dioxygenase [Paraburkholderia ginsengiterrae]
MRDLNEGNITQAVLSSLANMPEGRLRTIIVKLIQHLHAFAQETGLTEEEWKYGIDFLTETGHKCTETRQEFILLSDTLGLSQLVVAQSHRRPDSATEQTVFGPFHVPGAPEVPPHGADITNGAAGEPCFVFARVSTTGGEPIADALVDVWQADSDGYYDVQFAGWDLENASLRARLRTDDKGTLSVRTVYPRSYPIPTDGTVGLMLEAMHRHPMRPAHIHFMVQKPGFDTLVTHVFSDTDEYLDSDVVFGVRSSCIAQFLRHKAGIAPDGTTVNTAFYTMHCNLVLDTTPTA